MRFVGVLDQSVISKGGTAAPVFHFPRISLRRMNRFGWQASATARGNGSGSPLAQAAISSPLNGAVINPRDPCPLFTYSPSSHGHSTSGTCRASCRARHTPRQTAPGQLPARQSAGNPDWYTETLPGPAVARRLVPPRPVVRPGRWKSHPATPGCLGARQRSVSGHHCGSRNWRLRCAHPRGGAT